MNIAFFTDTYSPQINGVVTSIQIFSKELNEYIYVTGSHHMHEPKTGRFIKVSEFDGATKTDQFSEKLSCLVTDNNLIPVGEYTFWDWED